MFNFIDMIFFGYQEKMIIFECVSAFVRYDNVKVSVHNTFEKK